jgi:hypothetical protein
VTVKGLLKKAVNKDLFSSLNKYIDFTSEYLEFINDPSNIQAQIIAQNETNYKFIQYKKDGTYNVTRPMNSNLMYDFNQFESNKKQLISLLSNIKNEDFDTKDYRSILNNSIYTIQQCIGATLDALPANKSNTARKINGDLFERLIRILLDLLNIDCKSGVVQLPVKLEGKELFKMSYQHDLIIKYNDELKAIGSVKTSSKDRIDKIFLDKFLYCKITETEIPHFAVFLNDVQRKNTSRAGKYSISSTFLPGHFKVYTVKLNPLDGVYYCDIRPNMMTEDLIKDHIKTFDNLLFNDIWEFLK